MKKKVILALTATLLSLSMSVSAFAGTLSINFNGVNRVFKNATKINGTTFVDADRLSDVIYTNIDYNEFTKKIKISNASLELIMKVDSTEATLNDEAITLPVAPTFNEKGVLILPLRFIAETFGYEVSYDSAKGIITVLNDSPYISNLGGASDITEDTKVLTYDQAVETAINNSTSLKQTLINFDELDSSLSSINNAIDTNPINKQYDASSGTSFIFESPAVKSYYIQRETLLDLLALQDESVAAAKTRIEMTLIGNLIALDALTSNYELTKQGLDLQETNLKNTKLKYSLGLVSETDVNKAEADYDNSKVSLSKLETSIGTAKQNLNATLGLPLTSDTFVEYNVTVKDENFDVDAIVKSALKNSLFIKQAQNTLDAAERNFDYIATTESYNEKTRTLNNATLALSKAKTTTEQDVRNAYVEYKNAINNQKTLENAKQTAINNYNNGVVSYEAGYITEYELQGLNTAIISAEVNLLSNQLSYKLISFRLHHPELF